MAIFLITAPSGSGKTSIMNNVSAFANHRIGECVSHTTRPMRDGEVDGKTYYFIDNDTFNKMYENDELAERVVYHNCQYGISKKEIERVLSKYHHVYVIVEYDGYKQVKQVYPDAVGIFMYMSKEECMANMLLRGDSMSKALTRISTYEEEMLNKYSYDYVVKNVRNKQQYTAEIIFNIIRQYN